MPHTVARLRARRSERAARGGVKVRVKVNGSHRTQGGSEAAVGGVKVKGKVSRGVQGGDRCRKDCDDFLAKAIAIFDDLLG